MPDRADHLYVPFADPRAAGVCSVIACGLSREAHPGVVGHAFVDRAAHDEPQTDRCCYCDRAKSEHASVADGRAFRRDADARRERSKAAFAVLRAEFRRLVKERDAARVEAAKWKADAARFAAVREMVRTIAAEHPFDLEWQRLAKEVSA